MVLSFPGHSEGPPQTQNSTELWNNILGPEGRCDFLIPKTEESQAQDDREEPGSLNLTALAIENKDCEGLLSFWGERSRAFGT